MTDTLARPKVAVSVVFVLALFMSIMDIAIVNVALPSIGLEFRVAPAAVSAVSVGYLVSLAVVIPASGWLGDRFGRKRIMLGAIVLFTVASVLCGSAGTFAELVGFRVLQGIGGGMLTPVGVMVGSPLAARFVHPRLGPRWTSVIALTLIAASIASLTLVTSTAGLWPMRIVLFVLGIAIAHIFVPAQATAFTNVARVDTGAASTLFNALRQLGSALGVAALTTALTVAGGHPGDLYPYHVAFAVAALIALAGALVAVTITGRGRGFMPGRLG